MTVGNICVREVDLAEQNEAIQAAAQRMNARKVGTLVVLNESKEPIGILTDRDLAVRAVALGKDPYETTVKEVMTKSPHTVMEETPIERALEIMRASSCRRVPVVDRSGKLAGLLSLDDVVQLLSEEFRQIGELVEQEDPTSLGRG